MTLPLPILRWMNLERNMNTTNVSYIIGCNSQTSKHEYNKCMKVQHTKSTDQQAGQGPTDPVTIVNPHKCPLLNHDGNQATNELKA